jgi:hypothetical protein
MGAACAVLMAPATARAFGGGDGAGLAYFYIALVLPPVVLPLVLQLVVGLKLVPRYHHKLLVWAVVLAVPAAILCNWLGWGLLTLVAPTLPLAAVMLYESRPKHAIVALLATWGAGVAIWYASMFLFGTLGLLGMAIIWAIVIASVMVVIQIARRVL